MANVIYRNIVHTSCNGQHVNQETGEFEDYCEVLTGDYTPQRATRVLRRRTGDDSITINSTEKETSKYRMTVDVFMQHAEMVD